MTDANNNRTYTISDNVVRVRERIAEAAQRSGRRAEEITLIAVTKTQPVERILEAIAAGVQDFGENYVQEARAKIPAVQEEVKEPAHWHLIGGLQTNKAKYSVELFTLIHSVDSYQLAQELDKRAAKQGKIQSVLIQVNLSGAEQRSGILPEAMPELAEQIAGLPHLSLRGMMGVAPLTETAEAARPHFRTLYQLWETLPAPQRQVLSMGMSGDFEIAVEEGATHVRIGTALFGPRKPA
ncbi:MAG: YggS family pyridoxal phosphate-dependent enzyme [Armatimonadaceae bacterium]